MLEIYLLRHGQTVWNVEGRLQGHLNSSLTELGRSQARACGEILRNHLGGAQTRIISSPLGRCLETAAIVASALEVAVVEEDCRLQELCYGRWEGMTQEEILENDGETFRARKADRWNVPAPGGESYRDVAIRMASWLSEQKDESIVAISHGCAGRILRGVHAGMDHRAISRLEERHEAVHVLREGGLVEELNPNNGK